MNQSKTLEIPGQKFDHPIQEDGAQEPSLEDLATLYRVEYPTPSLEGSLELTRETLSSGSEGDGATFKETTFEKTDLDDNSFVPGLSPEEQEQINDRFLELKSIFESSDLSEEAKNFFLDGDVSAVIAGIKPMSYVQPELEEKKWGFIKKNIGLSKTDMVALQQVGKQLGILILRNEQLEAKRNEGMPELKNIALMLVINLQKTVDAMYSSGVFSDEEISEFVKDPVEAQLKGNEGKIDYIKNYRIGHKLGYPTSDVNDYIRSHKLQMKPPVELTDEEQKFLNDSVTARKGISVKGLRGDGVTWVSSNPELPATKQFQTKLQQTFAIQQQVFDTSI